MLVQVLQDSASLRAIKPLRNHLWGTQDRKQPRTFPPCCISLIAIRSSRQLPELRTENQAGSSPTPQLWQALGLLCWSPDSCSSLPRYILNLRKANQHTSVPAKTIFRAPEACVVPFPQRFPPRSSHPPPTPPTRTRRGHALRTALSAPARWHSTVGLHIPSCLTRPSPGSGDPGTPGAEAAGTAISPRGSRWHGTAQHGPARRRPRSLPGPARPAGRRRGLQTARPPPLRFLHPPLSARSAPSAGNSSNSSSSSRSPRSTGCFFSDMLGPAARRHWRDGGTARPALRLRRSAGRPPLSTASRRLPRRPHSAPPPAAPARPPPAAPLPAWGEQLRALRVETLKRHPRCSFRPHPALNARPRCIISLLVSIRVVRIVKTSVLLINIGNLGINVLVHLASHVVWTIKYPSLSIEYKAKSHNKSL